MGAVWTIALKDLRLLLRDKMGLFWCIGFPILMGTFMGTAFGGGPKAGRGTLGVVVVDEARTAASRDFLATLKTKEALYIEEKPREAATDLVRRGKFVAYLAIKPGFEGGFSMFAGGEGGLELGLDPSRTAEAGFLEGILMQAQFESLTGIMSDKDAMKGQLRSAREELTSATDLSVMQRAALGTLFGSLEQFMDSADEDLLASSPLAAMREGGGGIEKTELARDMSGQPRSAFDVTFPAAILWGLLGCASAFSISMVVERRQGTYQRLRTAPLSAAQVLQGKALACLIACLADIVLLLAVGWLVFGVHIGSVPLLAAAVVCTAVLFVGVTMLVSVLGKTEASVSGAGWAVFIVMMMFGGGMIPLIAMPGWMQTASSISPAKWAIVSLEGAIWRDFSAAEMLVPCAVTLVTGIALFAIGWVVFRRRDGA